MAVQLGLGLLPQRRTRSIIVAPGGCTRGAALESHRAIVRAAPSNKFTDSCRAAKSAADTGRASQIRVNSPS
jgi:hypothetical protein